MTAPVLTPAPPTAGICSTCVTPGWCTKNNTCAQGKQAADMPTPGAGMRKVAKVAALVVAIPLAAGALMLCVAFVWLAALDIAVRLIN